MRPTLINVDSTIHDREIVTAARAAKLLGVKRETLYAYVSRGLLTRVPRGYLLEEVRRLRARAQARSGHGPVASSALRWGEPVLDTAIAGIGPSGPIYRGYLATDLVRAGVSFERAAELLWTGALPAKSARWQAAAAPVKARALCALTEHSSLLARLQVLVTALGAREHARHGAARETEWERARRLIARMAALLTDASEASISATFARAIGLGPSRETAHAIDAALVLTADHELNASSFAARVAAGAGADLHACISAALATASGTKHGGECDRVEALVREATVRGASIVRERSERGESVPGFGHSLYPLGDPRAPQLIDLARSISKKATATIDSVIVAAGDTLGLAPTVDTGLVALSLAIKAPAGTAIGLFSLGRSAGWVAHVIEQREADFLMRPRARYVGPMVR